MRFGMAVALALLAGAGVAARSAPRPAPAFVHSALVPRGGSAAPVAPVAPPVLEADVGDVWFNMAIDCSVWIGTRLMVMADDILAAIGRELYDARGHGDGRVPRMPIDPAPVSPVTAAQDLPAEEPVR